MSKHINTSTKEWGASLCNNGVICVESVKGSDDDLKEPKLISLLGSTPPPHKQKRNSSLQRNWWQLYSGMQKIVQRVDFILHSQTFKWADWEKLFYWKICVRLSSICMIMPLPNVAAWLAPVILESFTYFQLFGTVNIWEMILYMTLLVQTLVMGCHFLWSEYLCNVLAPILIMTILEWNIVELVTQLHNSSIQVELVSVCTLGYFLCLKF